MADSGKDMDGGPDLNMDLDDLFAQARDGRPSLPEGLQAAILRDAAAVQAERQAPEPAGPARGGYWLQLRQAVGGWPALGGLVAVCAAGLWIGFTGPAFLPDPLDLVTATAAEEAIPYDSFDLAVLLAEDMQ